MSSLEDQIVEYCQKEREKKKDDPFAFIECFIRLRENPDELRQIGLEPTPDAIRVLDEILNNFPEEAVEECKEERGWMRFTCATFVSTYLKARRDVLTKYVDPSKIDRAIAELEKVVEKFKE